MNQSPPTSISARRAIWLCAWLLLFVCAVFAPRQTRASFTKPTLQSLHIPEVIAPSLAPQLPSEPRFKLEIGTGIICGNDPVNRHDPLGLKDFTGPDGTIDSSQVHSVLDFLDLMTTDFPYAFYHGLAGLPSQVNQGMAQARADIAARTDSGEYGPGTAAMARGLQFMGSFSAGITMAPLQPKETVVGLATAPVVLPYNFGSSLWELGSDPSLSKGFDVFENGLNVALMFGGAAELQSGFPALQNLRVPSLPQFPAPAWNPSSGGMMLNPRAAVAGSAINPWEWLFGDSPAIGMNVRRGVDIGIHRSPRHHLAPQQYRNFFTERGLPDIDSYTIPLDEATHSAIHTWMGSGPWNEVMMQRTQLLEATIGRQVVRREILQIMAQMRREAGLSHIKVIPYRD